MNISLYSTSDDPRKYNKTLTLIAENVSCKPANPLTLLYPRILLDYSASYAGVNYVYISDFDLYCFAEITLITGREMRLDCRLDPYNSFDLDEVQGLAIRSEAAGVNYVVDSKLPIDSSRFFMEGEDLSGDPLTKISAKEYLLITNS